MAQGRPRKNGPKADDRPSRQPPVVSLVERVAPDPRDWWPADVAEQMWPGWWASDAAGLWRDADHGLVFRLADLLARADLLEREADLEPITTGSTGQSIVHPGYRTALALKQEARALEKELGLTPASRLSMGLAAQTVQQRSLQELGEGAALRAVPADPRVSGKG